MTARLEAALWAFLRSGLYTLSGVLLGFISLAASTQVTAGGVTGAATSSPALFWAFVQTTWFAFLIVNLVPPILRAIAAAMKIPNGTT